MRIQEKFFHKKKEKKRKKRSYTIHFFFLNFVILEGYLTSIKIMCARRAVASPGSQRRQEQA